MMDGGIVIAVIRTGHIPEASYSAVFKDESSFAFLTQLKFVLSVQA
jgi:hypothetical protein